MKKITYSMWVFLLPIILVLTGCQTRKSKAVEGAVIGGIVGATAGGIIGHQSGHGGEGAGIGAGVGALVGAAIGSQMPSSQQSQIPTATGTVNPNQMSISNIVDLSKQGVNDAVIIDRIRLTNSKFKLTPEDVTYLKQNGVSDAVIQVMQSN